MFWQDLEEAIVQGYGTERSFLCHVHPDRNASASVNVLNGYWYCYTCHARGRVDMDGVELDPYAVKRRLKEIQRRIETAETIYPEAWLNLFDSRGSGSYWRTRFSEPVCRLHRLGETPEGDYATIPLRDSQGAVRGLVKRSLTGENPKYKYPYNVKLSHQLFNYDKARKELVVLTEGATDAIAFDEVEPGYSMAMWGSTLSRVQTKMIQRYAPKTVIVATDQDAPGERSYEEVWDRLHNFCQVLRATWTDYKDLAAIPLEERSDLVRYLVATHDLPSRVRVG
jgi:DNA primase